MTTSSLQRYYIPNIGEKNSLFHVPHEDDLQLSAIVWTVDAAGSRREARVECLNQALRWALEERQEQELWLLSAHRTFQPDNRITRYNGLWNSMRRSGILIPEGESIEAPPLLSKDGLRFFGAIKCGAEQLESIDSVLVASQSALAVLHESCAQRVVSSIIHHGWSQRNSNPPTEMLESICANAGIVVQVYGEFDDREVLAATIGRKDELLSRQA